MAAKSTFRLSGGFASSIERRRTGIREAAELAMEQAMAMAEKDAHQLRRWRDPGYYSEQDRFGDTWTWRVTGASEASITAYVVPHKRLKSLPGQRTIITREGADGFDKAYEHLHHTDASLTGDYQDEPDKVKGVVTMYTHYAPYLQQKEINGGVWGQPSPGSPVTVEVLEVYWDAVYVPMMERVMTSYMRRFAN